MPMPVSASISRSHRKPIILWDDPFPHHQRRRNRNIIIASLGVGIVISLLLAFGLMRLYTFHPH